MKYKNVIVTRKGSPEVLKIIENDLRTPMAGEARVKILATCVGRTDIGYRQGDLSFAPTVPFVPIKSRCRFRPLLPLQFRTWLNPCVASNTRLISLTRPRVSMVPVPENLLDAA